MEEIVCRGQLKEGIKLKWFTGIDKILSGNFDFVFKLNNDMTFAEKFKYIQDNNNLNFLRIESIQKPFPNVYQIIE